MSDAIRDSYIERIDARFAPLVTQLDGLVRRAGPELQSDIRYGIILYGLQGDFRTWVCAVSVTTKVVNLRFLYGVLLDDPGHLLRKGSATLCNLDYAPGTQVDEQIVLDYVREAIGKYTDFKASNAKAGKK